MGIVAFIIIISAIILFHELGHFIMAKRMGVKVEVFSLGLGPKLFSVKKGETEYTLSAVPLGGYVKMAGEDPGEQRTGAEWEFSSKPISKRFNIVVAGALCNYVLGFILFCLIFMLGAPISTSRVGRLLEGYPAEQAGIRENDVIISIDGKETHYWQDVIEAIHNRSQDEEIEIEVGRDDEVIRFSLKGQSEEQKDIFGKPVKVTLIGIAPSEEVIYVKHGFFKSVAIGAETTLRVTSLTYTALWRILTGSMSVKAVSGPIGIFAMTSQVAQKGVMQLLWISALISVSLALFNLLPLPILDGGHILFLFLEKIKGRPLDRKVQEVVQQIAMALLITFVLIVSWNDIMKFF
ncbi:MAG: RIP metalloprotease RseP [Candidatus Omnitrophica bacterium]|nr:RIP metalloprotease RseP [Candidatus Omnitrophota bacterium]